MSKVIVNGWGSMIYDEGVRRPRAIGYDRCYAQYGVLRRYGLGLAFWHQC